MKEKNERKQKNNSTQATFVVVVDILSHSEGVDRPVSQPTPITHCVRANTVTTMTWSETKNFFFLNTHITNGVRESKLLHHSITMTNEKHNKMKWIFL